MKKKTEFKLRLYIKLSDGFWSHITSWEVYNTGIRFPYYYKVNNPDNSEKLAHLERMVNGIEGESGCLLYLNDESNIIQEIAHRILHGKRDTVLLTYISNNVQGREEHNRVLGNNYPNLDKKRP